jgi:hypothetical protein
VAVGDDVLRYQLGTVFTIRRATAGARVESSVTRFDVLVTIGRRNFTLGCAIRFEHSRAEGSEIRRRGIDKPLRALSAESACDGHWDADDRMGDEGMTRAGADARCLCRDRDRWVTSSAPG